MPVLPDGSIANFYNEYHGHECNDLTTLADTLPQGRGVVYLVGDSTFDNKFWLDLQFRPACNGYERVLKPPRSVPDVAYNMNQEIEHRGLGDRFCCINAAVEESTLGLRDGGNLLPQDAFVQRSLCERDVVVVSLGGNDIALRPTAWTVAAMIALIMSPSSWIKRGIAPGMGHFVRLFRDSTTRYLQTLTAERKPRCIACCMLYYLDESVGGSWADLVLRKLGYDTDPEKLQLIIREIFERATCQIALDGVDVVVPVPMYEALDGKTTSDYVQRVEPSSSGGHKLAALIMDRLEPALRTPLNSAMDKQQRAGAASTCSQQTVAMPSAVHHPAAGSG